MIFGAAVQGFEERDEDESRGPEHRSRPYAVREK